MSLAFDRFSIENLRDLSKNVLTLSVFELEKCSFFLNRSEFHQKLIGSIISAVFLTKISYVVNNGVTGGGGRAGKYPRW